jgi:hypothetical protein
MLLFKFLEAFVGFHFSKSYMGNSEAIYADIS